MRSHESGAAPDARHEPASLDPAAERRLRHALVLTFADPARDHRALERRVRAFATRAGAQGIPLDRLLAAVHALVDAAAPEETPYWTYKAVSDFAEHWAASAYRARPGQADELTLLR